MIEISNKLMTTFTYFCKLELGKSISMTVASKIKMMIFVIHSVKKFKTRSSYRTIIVKFPAATITVIHKKNMNETIESAAKT